MLNGILDVRHLPLPFDFLWSIYAIQKSAWQHYHCTPPLTVGNILSEIFQFHKIIQIDALLNFHPSHESSRATRHYHTQTKLRGKPTDVERRVWSCSIWEGSRSITFHSIPTSTSFHGTVHAVLLFSKVHTSLQFVHGFQPSICIQLNFAGNKEKSLKIIRMNMFAVYGKAKPDIGNITGLNLGMVKLMTIQMTKLWCSIRYIR
jgi:hypothetical protein